MKDINHIKKFRKLNEYKYVKNAYIIENCNVAKINIPLVIVLILHCGKVRCINSEKLVALEYFRSNKLAKFFEYIESKSLS